MSTSSFKPLAAAPPAGWWLMVRTAVEGWINDRASSMGASLAYYTFFSMAPLLLIVISVAGLLLGPEAAQGHLFGELSGMLGSQAAASIQALLASADKPADNWWGTVIGLGVMAVGATTVFAELQGSLDHIWQAPLRPGGGGLWSLLRAGAVFRPDPGFGCLKR